MKMPGFRPGKVPASIVRQQYGEQARMDALSEALGRLFSEAVSAQQLRVAGTRRSRRRTAGSTTHMEFSAVFEVFPEITLSDLVGVEVERRCLRSVRTEIDGTLEILRKQRVRYEPVDRAAARRPGEHRLPRQEGWRAFPGGQGKDYRFVLGEGKMLSDFENAVIGTVPAKPSPSR
jgi:trigger factor